jgi:hypothetical protein
MRKTSPDIARVAGIFAYLVFAYLVDSGRSYLVLQPKYVLPPGYALKKNNLHLPSGYLTVCLPRDCRGVPTVPVPCFATYVRPTGYALILFFTYHLVMTNIAMENHL